MNRESVSLALAGALIGALALSATIFAHLHPPKREESASAPVGMQSETPAEAWEEGPVVPVLAEQDPAEDLVEEDPAAGPFQVHLWVPDPIPGEKLFVCDRLGCPLEGIEPDENGEVILGPLPPGRYSIWAGQTEVGSFRLRGDAALSDTAGRVWTEGRLLWLERFTPGTVRLSVTMAEPGYYTLGLRDRDGRSWNRDLYVPDSEEPKEPGLWVRTLDFPGLSPGLYTAVRRNQPLGQVELKAGETALLEIGIDN
jgi:hypothetical protein